MAKAKTVFEEERVLLEMSVDEALYLRWLLGETEGNGRLRTLNKAIYAALSALEFHIDTGLPGYIEGAHVRA